MASAATIRRDRQGIFVVFVMRSASDGRSAFRGPRLEIESKDRELVCGSDVSADLFGSANVDVGPMTWDNSKQRK